MPNSNDTSQPKENSRQSKNLVKLLLITGGVGLIGFMCALVAMLTHYKLFHG